MATLLSKDQVKLSELNSDFSNWIFVSCLKIFKTCSPSVFLKTDWSYTFLKAKKLNQNLIWKQVLKCLKFWLSWGKKWTLRTLWRILHMFLDILEFTVENKKKIIENCYKNIVSDVKKEWPKCPQNYFKKVQKKHTMQTRTKLVLLVDFWDQIFKTVVPKHFFYTLNYKMSRNMRKMSHKVRNGQNLPHESPNFTNYFFGSNFTYKLSHVSTSLRPHYWNSFF